MTAFKDILEKVSSNDKEKADDDFIYENLKQISTNTKDIKGVSKDIKKLSKEMKSFTKTFEKTFKDRFKESESAYEGGGKEKSASSIDPSKVSSGSEGGKSSGWGGKLFGAAVLGGLGAYMLNDDFKNTVKGVINGIGQAILGDDKWNEIKDKFTELSTKTTQTIDKFISNVTNFDKISENISKTWKEHWDDILLSVAGVSMALRPMRTLADSIKVLTNAAELFKTLGGARAIAGIVAGFLSEPIVLGAIAAASIGYLMKEAPKYWDKDYSGVEGSMNMRTSKQQMLDEMDTNIRVLEARIKANQDKKDRTANDISEWHTLKSDIKSLKEQRGALYNTPEKALEGPSDAFSKSLEGNAYDMGTLPQIESSPIPDTSLELPSQSTTSEDQAKKILENSNKAILKKYGITSNEPQRMSVEDYNNTYGATYASNEPIPYPMKDSFRGDNVNTAMDFFMSNQFTKEQAAGIVGNLQVESGPGLDPNISNASGHYGIAQWDGNRRANFMKEMGKSIYGSTLMDQLKFILKELPSNGLSNIKKATTAEEAAIAFEKGFERSGGQLLQRRVANANALMGKDYVPTQEPVKGFTPDVPTPPEKAKDGADKSLGLLAPMKGLLSKLASKNFIQSGDIDYAQTMAANRYNEIKSRVENISGGLIGDLNGNLKNSERSTQVSPTINTNNIQPKQASSGGGGGGDIASPIDMDIVQIMMHVI